VPNGIINGRENLQHFDKLEQLFAVVLLTNRTRFLDDRARKKEHLFHTSLLERTIFPDYPPI